MADVSKFFKTYYAPNNAALVIVGDIQIPEAKKLIETYFGDIPSQPQPKRPDLTEPAIHARIEVYNDPLARVPAVMIGLPGTERRSPDYYALNMLDAMLTGGNSSRFRLDLVKGKESLIQYESNLAGRFELAGLSRSRRLRHVPALQAQLHAAADCRSGEENSPSCKTRLIRGRSGARQDPTRATMIKQLQSSLSRAHNWDNTSSPMAMPR